jgi:hypothetical protein
VLLYFAVVVKYICSTIYIFIIFFKSLAESSSSKKVQHASLTKAIGSLVAVVTVSILSMAAIAMLLGGFYKGSRKVTLDEQTSEDDGHALKPVSTTLINYHLFCRE